ncbi:MAG: hypothetical protein J6386_15550 [Candidatus Synoicihabitans palmerolidicus]|nr:hypothetical protein [Candidatus Synoicihabitans palmerolidicus]
MTSFFSFLLWCVLFILCWSLALLALIAYPVVWVLLLPFKLIGVLFTGVLRFLQGLVLLPARLLGWRPSTA